MTAPPGREGPSAEHRVIRAVGTISFATLISRILGFARDMVVARAFGAVGVTDAFFVAFRIPNLLRRLLGEGALSTAFIPVFAEYRAKASSREFARMLRAISGAMVAVLAAVTLAGILLAPWIVKVTAPGFWSEPAKALLTVGLTRLMFPYLFFVGLAALATGVLNFLRHFLTPALSPVVFNLSLIAATLWLAPSLPEPITALAWGVLLGGVGQLCLQLPALVRRGISLRLAVEPDHPAIGRISRLLAPTIFGLAVTQLNVFVNTLIASFLREGSISYLYYADRVMEFPFGIFSIAIATAVLPTMADQAVRQQVAELKATLAFALRLVVFISIPASLGLLILADPIVRVLFERGQFGPASTAATAWALGFYALGLTTFSAVKVVAPAFYALRDTRTPVWIGIGAMAVNVGASLLLMGPLAHGGLALATTLASAVNTAGLLFWLRRRIGRLGLWAILGSLGRTALAALAMAFVCLGSLALQPSWVTVSRWAEAGWLGFTITLSIGVYLVASLAMGGQEVNLVRDALQRRKEAPPVISVSEF